jgi:DNA (cytosine-5)-methyltransferase 1
MGLPDTFKIPVSDTRAYKQFGNCVATPVIHEVARLMVQFIAAADNQPDLPYLAAAE